MAVLVALLAVVVALLGVLVAGLLRSHAEILRSLHELGAGVDPDVAPSPARAATPAPRRDAASRVAHDVAGVTPSGDAISVSIPGAPHPTLLAFLTTGCTTCADFWSAFSDRKRNAVPGDARLVVVLKGVEAESAPRARKLAPTDGPVVMSSPAWDDYDIPVAPYFVYVDGPSSQIVGEGAASTWAQLVTMLERAIEESGIDTGSTRRRPRSLSGRARAAQPDRDLRAAGIEPGDTSLYPTARPEADAG